MDKAEARREAIRMWRALPPNEHRHHKQATAFAKLIAPLLDFETLGDHDKIVEGWLQQDLIETEEAARKFSQKLKNATTPVAHRRQPTPVK
ncbi:MAG TPA: hypothetical protein VHA07_04010 [Devosia sp.]|nr:hypothetical protein [Devosia sp.]